MTTVVAAMIVKNEAAVIARCIDSLVPYIERILVNDNGSTDNTPSILKQFDEVALVPGPWVDFATNRNLVLDAARNCGDYVLCGIDADEELVAPEDFEWPKLTADAYNINVHLDNLVYPRVALVKSSHPWCWKYPVQEGLYSDADAVTYGTIAGVYIKSYRGEGARSRDLDTQKKDLTLLQRAVEENPNDTRMTFYLAQQYKDMKNYPAAIEMYTKRLAMQGYEAERWYSCFMIGRTNEWMGYDPTAFYLQAFSMDPTRAEPLYYAADWYRRRNNHALSFVYASTGAMLRCPENGLFVESDVYIWKLLDTIATVAYYTPFKAAGAEAAKMLVGLRGVPAEHMPRIMKNYSFYVSK